MFNVNTPADQCDHHKGDDEERNIQKDQVKHLKIKIVIHQTFAKRINHKIISVYCSFPPKLFRRKTPF